MAFGRLESRAHPQPMGEINMTPLIDVMLVLLVIFMITAPLLTSGLKLDLPKSDAARPVRTPQFVSLMLAPGGEVYLGEEKLPREALAQRLAAAAKADPATEVQLRADQAVPYGRVAELIGLVQQAGLNRIAFVAQPGAPR